MAWGRDVAEVETKTKMLAYYEGVIVRLISEKFGWTKERTDSCLRCYFLAVQSWSPWAYIRSKKSLSREELSEFLDNCKYVCRSIGIDPDIPW
jgi:hypothetical protein